MRKNRLKFLARHDPLTGAYNRHSVSSKIKRWLKRKKTVTILVMDIDDLKLLNDSLGHAAGDALIQEVVDRCQAQLHADDIFGRFGGDEFVFGSCRFPDKAHASRWGHAILDVLTMPFVYQGRPVRISAAAGLAQTPEDGTSIDELLSVADLAMYESKASLGRELRVAAAGIRAGARQQEVLRKDFRRALANDELELFFQPKIRLADQTIDGFEALIRWWHPERGLLTPDEFLPAIQQHIVGLDLANYVIDRACRQACAWRAEGLRGGHIAVNIDNLAFFDLELNNSVLNRLFEDQALAEVLELELTEQVSMYETSETLHEMLRELRDLGYRVALDDFGTGIASLSLLERLPFDVLKVDRSFISALDCRSERATMVEAMIKLSQGLGKQVVAEGVERPAQADWLLSRGCDAGQGFFFARPLRASRATALLHGRYQLGDPAICDPALSLKDDRFELERASNIVELFSGPREDRSVALPMTARRSVGRDNAMNGRDARRLRKRPE
jgi:diguanylate cyclase (GGDEF)-like protein